MLRLRFTDRLPAAHEERPARPEHHGRARTGAAASSRCERSTRWSSPSRCPPISSTKTGTVSGEADPEAPGEVRPARGSARPRRSAPRAPAPCRRSGSCRARPAGSAGASGRCRSCPAPPARRGARCPAPPRYRAGSATNFVRHPAEQKWKVVPAVLGAVLRRAPGPPPSRRPDPGPSCRLRVGVAMPLRRTACPGPWWSCPWCCAVAHGCCPGGPQRRGAVGGCPESRASHGGKVKVADGGHSNFESA